MIFGEFAVPGGLLRRFFGTARDDPGVRVVEEREGKVTHLVIITTNCLDITITVQAQLHNTRAFPALPLTVETHGRRRVELVTLQSIDPAQPESHAYS